jgi:hypothetical protein
MFIGEINNVDLNKYIPNKYYRGVNPYICRKLCIDWNNLSIYISYKTKLRYHSLMNVYLYM